MVLPVTENLPIPDLKTATEKDSAIWNAILVLAVRSLTVSANISLQPVAVRNARKTVTVIIVLAPQGIMVIRAELQVVHALAAQRRIAPPITLHSITAAVMRRDSIIPKEIVRSLAHVIHQAGTLNVMLISNQDNRSHATISTNVMGPVPAAPMRIIIVVACRVLMPGVRQAMACAVQ